MVLSNAPFLSGIVTLLAVFLYLYMAARVGILRGRLGIKAPATTGDPLFERAFRVHCNTGEQYIAFLTMASNVGLIVLTVIGLIAAR